ncbi:MAG: phospho-sugar mutase [Defluviitaleaceae bacterium]|nr:phospho-sugar mutase [Defluviitaleaceae bacterium]
MSFELAYQKWLENEHLETALSRQLEEMTEAEKEDAFYKSLEFGTAGMRGLMGPGTNRMNIYTIRKANVGFAQYLLNHVEQAKSRGVAIAYDSRHFSLEFALESAKVLATQGIKTYLFEGVRPTPELSFAVRHLGCAGGIVITASHNPPEYNGYKIYDESGCQTLPGEGDKVIAGVHAVDDVFAIEVKSESVLRADGLIVTIGSEIDDAYLACVKGLEINPDLDKSGLKIVFSPLHGTAGMLTTELMRSCGYEGFQVVAEQAEPDGRFITVDYPNPEDAAAFEYAIRLGEKMDADLLLATDPDADRMGVAAKGLNGQYVLLTGNQTGAVLTYYILSQRQAKGTLPEKGRLFDTIVSSELAAKIARSYGLETISTLTGFKFIGEQIRLMEGSASTYVFGYEESYGSLIGDFVRDKDAIQAVLILSEAAAYYQAQGKTLCDVLDDIYCEFGYYEEDLVNISLAGKEGSEKIQLLLSEFRQTPPQWVAGLKVVVIEDYQTSERIEGATTSTIDLPAADVLKYILEDGSWFVLRPSGTEPKAKIYISVVTDDQQQTAARVEHIKRDVLTKVDLILK